MYCVEPSQKIGNSVNYNTISEAKKEENTLAAYILSEPDNGTGYTNLVDSPVQQAIWAWKNDMEDMQNDLYHCAEKFKEYRDWREHNVPTIDTSSVSAFENGNGGYTYGPFKLSYTSTKWNGRTLKRSFGEITEIKVTNNGRTVDFEILNKNKVKLDDNEFPKSDKLFYIETETTNPISVKISFNDVEATGYYKEIKGKYTINKMVLAEGASPEKVDYCPECQEKIGVNKIDTNGYVYKLCTINTRCGAIVKDTDSGNTGIDLSGENHTHQSGYCGESISVPTEMDVSTGKSTGSQIVKCGQGYDLNAYYMVGSSKYYIGNVHQTANCGRNNTRSNVEYRDYIAKIGKKGGCGRTVETGYTYIDKTGNLITNRKNCGEKYVIVEDETEDVQSQVLIQRWGERKIGSTLDVITETPGQKILKVDFNTKKPLAGASFQILSSDGRLMDHWVSQKDAHIINPPLGEGTYILREVDPPSGYEKMKDMSFTVNSKGNIVDGTIVVDNKKTSSVEVAIEKIDDKTRNKVAGARLKLTNTKDKDGNTIDNGETIDWYTDEKEDMILYLAPGEYTLSEIVTPKGYSTANDITFIITGNENKKITITMEEPQHDGIDIYKIEKGGNIDNDTIAGAKLSLYAIYRNGDMNYYTGETVTTYTKHFVRSWTTEENKAEHFAEGEIFPGTYKLVEDEAPDGYVLGEDLTFKIVTGLYIEGNKGKNSTWIAYENSRLPRVRIAKLDEKSKDYLSGAILEIYNENGKCIKHWVSENKYKTFHLKDGRYTLKEVEAPEGYELAKDINFKVEGQDIDIVMLDKRDGDTLVDLGRDLSLRKYIVEIDGKGVERAPDIKMEPLTGSSYGITGYGSNIEEVESDEKEPIDEQKNEIEIEPIILNAETITSNDILQGKDGWYTNNGKKYYYKNGTPVKGFKTINEETYYFDNTGVMQKGWKKINSNWYYFDENTGVMLKGWEYIPREGDNRKRYFFDYSTGIMHTGWLYYHEHWYYFSPNGKSPESDNIGQLCTGWCSVDNNRYYLNDGQEAENRGAVLAGKYEIAPGEWYYFNPDTSGEGTERPGDYGKMLKGWQTIKDKKLGNLNYYFCQNNGEFEGFKDGQMLMGRHIMSDINGVVKHIYFNKIYTQYPQGAALIPSTSTADYNHTKNPEKVHVNTAVNSGSVITYKICVYNEGPDVDMRALEIKDYKSDFLEFLPNDEVNKLYGWTIDGNTLTTTALRDTTIEKCNDINTPNSAYVLLRLRVKSNVPYGYNMVNIAEITKYGDAYGNDISNEANADIDSTAGNFPDALKNDAYRGNGKRGNSYVQGQEDDDDFDIVIANYTEDFIDLSLRKYITGISDKNGKAVTMTTDEGKNEISNDSRIPEINCESLPLSFGADTDIYTATYTHPKTPIDVCEGDLVTYTISVYNEHFALDAYAMEITDYIPDGLEFVTDNPINAYYNWKKKKDENGNEIKNIITTSALSETKLDKYEGNELSTASVQVVLRVTNGVNYNEYLRNIAEISQYGAYVGGIKVTGLEYDRDSRANNVNINDYNPPADNSTYQEDDDDYELLRLTMMNISGRLWIDEQTGKQNERNGLIDSFEKGLNNHKVTLSGGESRIETTYDDNGNYFIGRLYINKKYSLAFEYEGQEYIDVEKKGIGIDQSAGAEPSEKRNELNAKFYEIVKGTARNSDKENTIGLTYNTSGVTKNTQISELDRNTTFNNLTLIEAITDEFDGETVYKNGNNSNINQGVKLRTQSALALTSDIDCVDVTINGDRLTYDYKQANDMVHVSVNGQETNKIQRDEGELIDIKLKEEDLGRVYTQVVYESDYNFRIDDYKDYTEEKLDPTKTVNRELEAYVTYRLKIRNNSSTDAGASELKIYYDNTAFKYFNKVFDEYNAQAKEMEDKDSWFVAYKSNIDGTKTVIKEGTLAWEEASESSFDGFGAIKTSATSGLKEVILNPNDEMYIYIRFQFLKNDDEENGIKRKIVAGDRYIVGEITGYTTPEGLIDYYSQPNNIDLKNPWENYKAEYDTTRAPGVIIGTQPKDSNPRQISGFVFEDARTNTISSDDLNMAGILTGDGKYDASQGDTKKSGVIVQLIEQVDIEGKHYEYIWQETTTGDTNGAVKYMDKNGTLHNDHGLDPVNDIHNDKQIRHEGNFGEGGYKFTNFVPGNYIVRFIYGDTVVDNKVLYSGQDYKYTIYNDEFAANTSNAKDNPVRRNIAMNFSNSSNNNNAIDYRMSRILQNIGVETEELRKNTWINADTKKMKVEIGSTGLGHEVNFGIVERPKSQLSIKKEIVGVKVSNKGIIIIDTENGQGKPIVEPYNNTFQELDDELINGAILEVKYRITVSNVGELDTLYNYYEGNTTYGTNQGKHITTAATLVYDYPERIGFDASTNPTWTANDVDLDILWDQVKSNIQGRVQNGTGLVIKAENQDINKELIPTSSNQEGDKTVSSEVILKRVLSRGQSDGFVFNNMTEIIKTKNAVGRRDAVNTFGNYIPFSEDINNPNDPTNGNNETDASYAQVLVTSNTGLQYNPHYEIWIMSGAILVVGIILIKIFVLPKKKKDKEF